MTKDGQPITTVYRKQSNVLSLAKSVWQAQAKRHEADEKTAAGKCEAERGYLGLKPRKNEFCKK